MQWRFRRKLWLSQEERALRAAIRSLSEIEQQVIMLRARRLKLPQIAEALGLELMPAAELLVGAVEHLQLLLGTGQEAIAHARKELSVPCRSVDAEWPPRRSCRKTAS